MKALSKANDPALSRKLNRKIILALVAGGLSAYGVLILAAMVASAILD